MGFLLYIASLDEMSRRSAAMNRSKGDFERRKACNIAKGMKEVQISKRVIEEGQNLQVECEKADWWIIEQNGERHG